MSDFQLEGKIVKVFVRDCKKTKQGFNYPVSVQVEGYDSSLWFSLGFAGLPFENNKAAADGIRSLLTGVEVDIPMVTTVSNGKEYYNVEKTATFSTVGSLIDLDSIQAPSAAKTPGKAPGKASGGSSYSGYDVLGAAVGGATNAAAQALGAKANRETVKALAIEILLAANDIKSEMKLVDGKVVVDETATTTPAAKTPTKAAKAPAKPPKKTSTPDYDDDAPPFDDDMDMDDL